MACGACEPEAFRAPIGTTGRVFGYTCAHDNQTAVRQLYFHGCEFVFWDVPSAANVLKRPSLKRLLKVMRTGDALVIARDADLGSRPASQNAAQNEISKLGISLMLLVPSAHYMGN